MNGVFGNLGLGLGPGIAGILAFLTGWRNTYFILAIPVLIFGVIMVFTSIDETAVG